MSDQKTGWSALLSGKSGIHSLTLAGGVALHAINVYIVVTILPSLVHDIGGEKYYSWAATIFVTASLIGASFAGKVLAHTGSRSAYIIAALIFALGTFGCGYAASMPVFLLARLVQGFGGGILLALTYSMVRIVFGRPLWPRAMGLISGMWGISSLLGPAIGGIFAEYDNWRTSFWLVGCLAVVFSIFAFAVLPRQSARKEKTNPLPFLQLALLTLLLLAISTGSAMESAWAKIAGLLIGFLLLLLLAFIDRCARYRILPRSSFSPGSVFFSIYVMMLILITVVNGAELFLPLFLQNLHGSGPLLAGYLASLMSIGWTCGSLSSAGINLRRLPPLIILSPLLCLAGLAVLLFLIPGKLITAGCFFLISIALLIIGTGSGIVWPHLLTCILRYASNEDTDLASASLTSVQLFGTALSAAIAGTVTNLAGLNNPGGIQGTAQAATILFVFLIMLLFASLPCVWHIARVVRNEEKIESCSRILSVFRRTVQKKHKG